MRHLTGVVLWAARHPRVAWLGMREFRTDCTTHYDYPLIESYDAGRELAHMVTLRRFDQAVSTR
jgi:hypothetical protein